MADDAPVVSDAAPVVEGGDAAPKEEAENPIIDAAAPAKPPKVRTIDDDLEDVLKKHGGLKYKVKGKERSVTSTADIKRYLSHVDGIQEASASTAKERQIQEQREQLIAQLPQLSPAQRVQALKHLGVDPALVREAIEEEILSESRKAKEQSHLTPEQRAFKAEQEKFYADRDQFAQHQTQLQRQEQQRQYVAKVQETRERMENVAGKVLQRAKIDPGLVHMFLGPVADVMHRNETNGLDLSEEDIAEVVATEHEQMASAWIKGKSPDALHESLEAAGILQPLLQYAAKKIRERVNGTGNVAAPAPAAPKPAEPNGANGHNGKVQSIWRAFGK